MKLELSIADDRNLRQWVRDLVKGEVTSLLRGEIRGILKEVVEEQGGTIFSQDGLEKVLKKVLEQEIQKAVKDLIIAKRYGETSFLQNQIRLIAEEMLREKFSENK